MSGYRTNRSPSTRCISAILASHSSAAGTLVSRVDRGGNAQTINTFFRKILFTPYNEEKCARPSQYNKSNYQLYRRYCIFMTSLAATSSMLQTSGHYVWDILPSLGWLACSSHHISVRQARKGPNPSRLISSLDTNCGRTPPCPRSQQQYRIHMACL